jgi:hypothetical protein
MSKIIKATITFEYLVDENEILSGLSDADQIDYVKETTVEDIMNMDFGNSNDLYDSIEIEVINEN